MRYLTAKQRLLSLDIRFGHFTTAATPTHFRAALAQLRNWFAGEPLFKEFLSRHKAARDKRLQELQSHILHHQQNAISVGLPSPETFDDQLAAVLAAIDAATVWAAPPVAQMTAQLGHSFTPLQLALMVLGHVARDGKTAGEMLSLLRGHLLVLRDHLNEYIGLLSTAYSLIQRYKERTESFRAAALRSIAATASGSKEGGLARDLYTYLHDQGVNFSVEPASASGEPDLVSVLENDRRLIVDAKYVHDKDEAKRTLVKGFRQVLDYCRDHHEPSGFLVVYLNTDVQFDIKSDDGFGGMKLGDYIVQFCVIDIFEHPTTASKRPKPNVVEISAADLVTNLPASAAQSPP